VTVILEKVNAWIWGIPTLFLILGLGLYLSLRSRFAQIQLFPKALRTFLGSFYKKTRDGDGSPFRAVCTALAATVGTGNMAGVAGAIAIGGPGAVFWIWISGILGMMTKFAEATLCVHFKHRNAGGETVGGPMYMIQKGMGIRWRWLALLYSFFGLVAAFGVGNATQINAVVGAVSDVLPLLGLEVNRRVNLLIGIILTILCGILLFGGAHVIGSAAERLVPAASVVYIGMGIVLIAGNLHTVPGVLQRILTGAFTPGGVTGGMVGSALITLRTGISRGVFTNEAGMGTAGIAHAAAKVSHPVEQGLLGIMEVFLDTIVICSVTAFVILCSGVGIPYGEDIGIRLTNEAFMSYFGSWSSVPIALCLSCFAFATILGWGLYGARCAQFLFGTHAWKLFAFFQTAAVLIGAILKTQTVWLLAEIVNALMAIPNLIALTVLSPVLFTLIREYQGAHRQMRS